MARCAALLALAAHGVTAGDDGIQTTPAMGAPSRRHHRPIPLALTASDSNRL